jgi:hypothetical protein
MTIQTTSFETTIHSLAATFAARAQAHDQTDQFVAENFELQQPANLPIISPFDGIISTSEGTPDSGQQLL